MSVKTKVVAAAILWSVTAVACGWYSYRLLALPDRTFTDRTCALFHTDVREAAVTMRTTAVVSVKHPLARELWWPVGWVVRQAVGRYLPSETATSIAACIVMALFASSGMLACVLAAAAYGIPLPNLMAAIPVAILSTANVIVLIPEYYGISYFLLSVTFLVAVVFRGRTRTVLLATSTALLAATTLTNAVFGVLCLMTPDRIATGRRTMSIAMRSVGMLIVIVFAVLVVGALSGWFSGYGTERRDAAAQERVEASVFRSLRVGRIESPGRLFTYSGLAWVYPIIGPTPHIANTHPFPRMASRQKSSSSDGRLDLSSDGRLDLSYDPWSIRDYGLISGVSAIVWVGYLLWCMTTLCRAGGQQRRTIGLLAAWIGGNILVHLVWGDEMFMYSPHWSWALSMIPLLGSGSLPMFAALGISATVVAGQLVTLQNVLELANQIPSLC